MCIYYNHRKRKPVKRGRTDEKVVGDGLLKEQQRKQQQRPNKERKEMSLTSLTVPQSSHCSAAQKCFSCFPFFRLTSFYWCRVCYLRNLLMVHRARGYSFGHWYSHDSTTCASYILSKTCCVFIHVGDEKFQIYGTVKSFNLTCFLIHMTKHRSVQISKHAFESIEKMNERTALYEYSLDKMYQDHFRCKKLSMLHPEFSSSLEFPIWRHFRFVKCSINLSQIDLI